MKLLLQPCTIFSFYLHFIHSNDSFIQFVRLGDLYDILVGILDFSVNSKIIVNLLKCNYVFYAKLNNIDSRNMPKAQV